MLKLPGSLLALPPGIEIDEWKGGEKAEPKETNLTNEVAETTHAGV
jgi:hypothetical protein